MILQKYSRNFAIPFKSYVCIVQGQAGQLARPWLLRKNLEQKITIKYSMVCTVTEGLEYFGNDFWQHINLASLLQSSVSHIIAKRVVHHLIKKRT